MLERTSDGRVVETLWDRSGPAIRTRTGSGAVTAVGLDGSGRALFELRPQGRGRTSYAYDLDGRLLRKSALVAEASGAGGTAETWDEVYGYDSSGRLVQVTHEDGTVETRSYHGDGTVAERVTRDGVRVSYTYDSANRMTGAVPSWAGAGDPPPRLVGLDAGEAYEWDAVGRRVAARRGRSGVAGLDAELAVERPSFDLASRVREEVVGNACARRWWGIGRRSSGATTSSATRWSSVYRRCSRSPPAAAAVRSAGMSGASTRSIAWRVSLD